MRRLVCQTYHSGATCHQFARGGTVACAKFSSCDRLFCVAFFSGVDSSGEKSFIQHIQGKAHANKAGRYGFAGLLPNDAGIIPPLSFDPSNQSFGADGGSFASQVNFAGGGGGGKKNKADENIYRCKSCLVDSSGLQSFLEHINGKAHIRKAGRIGFSGLLPNGENVLEILRGFDVVSCMSDLLFVEFCG